MELRDRFIEHERQEIAVARPQLEVEVEQSFTGYPFEDSLVVMGGDLAGPGVGDEDETEPVLASPAEPWPGDRAAKAWRLELDPGLLAYLPDHRRHDVLAGLDLAAEAVVLAEVEVVGTALPVDHE